MHFSSGEGQRPAMPFPSDGSWIAQFPPQKEGEMGRTINRVDLSAVQPAWTRVPKAKAPGHSMLGKVPGPDLRFFLRKKGDIKALYAPKSC